MDRGNERLDAFVDLRRRFAARSAVAKQVPAGAVRLNLLERQPFVVAAIPLTEVRLDMADIDEARERACVARATQRAGFASRNVNLAGLADAFQAGLAIINAETWTAFGYLVDSGKLGADLGARLRAASSTTPDQVSAAESVRRSFTAAVDHALESVDVIVMPTLPALPITLDDARRGVSGA